MKVYFAVYGCNLLLIFESFQPRNLWHSSSYSGLVQNGFHKSKCQSQIHLIGLRFGLVHEAKWSSLLLTFNISEDFCKPGLVHMATAQGEYIARGDGHFYKRVVRLGATFVILLVFFEKGDGHQYKIMIIYNVGNLNWTESNIKNMFPCQGFKLIFSICE